MEVPAFLQRLPQKGVFVDERLQTGFLKKTENELTQTLKGISTTFSK